MSERRLSIKYNAVTPIEVGKETQWHKIGVAWSDRDGGPKITIILKSIPFRSEYIYLFPADDKDRDDFAPDPKPSLQQRNRRPPPPDDDEA